MSARLRAAMFAAALVLALPSSAGAAIEPPWCGTPEPDASEGLPGFPHIPYYAIGCTLERIRSQSDGRMTVEVVGESATGRPMYGVTINALDTVQRRRAFQNWQEIRRVALTDPARGQALLAAAGDAVKVPIFVQGGIHGNEYEGVDAVMRVVETLATSNEPQIQELLDRIVFVFNVIQNPDGRVGGHRANGNGFDLNRDYITQSQSETIASIDLMKKWLPPEVLDLHGYTDHTLVETTTKPHNPSIEYDLWLKWNQPRIDANEAALASGGFPIWRPINEWCPESNPDPETNLCNDGNPGNPDVAEGWDDWGPFYTAMYAQHLGLDSSTVEMCDPDFDLEDFPSDTCTSRAHSLQTQLLVTWSTYDYVSQHRIEMLHDMLEIYRRGVTDAPRPACCVAPFSTEHHDYMHDYPKAYVIPVGAGQRSTAETARLVNWLLYNDIEVHELKQDYRYGDQVLERGSYVVWMAQARRGLLDTALGAGQDVSDRVSRLYAPPAAWSHGFLWGADVISVPDAAEFAPITNRVLAPNDPPGGGVEPGQADRYALVIDSPAAVRTLNSLVGDGVSARLVTEPSQSASGATLPAGTVLFGADPKTRNLLSALGAKVGLKFLRVTGALPATEAIEGVPRIAVLTNSAAPPALTQEIWSLRELGFRVERMPINPTLRSTGANPLDGFDLVFSTLNVTGSANAPARTNLAAFFANGGGYLGALVGGTGLPGTVGAASGIATANRAGSGRSGIVNWVNASGPASPITGAYPATDTAIMDPPTWFTGVGPLAVDARLPSSNLLLSGMWKWQGDSPSATAPNAPIVIHGAAGNARMTLFAMNPLYRADPEREWPMVGSAAYWADR